jgi:hypothetical protein
VVAPLGSRPDATLQLHGERKILPLASRSLATTIDGKSPRVSVEYQAINGYETGINIGIET